jgi:hypothetical protein
MFVLFEHTTQKGVHWDFIIEVPRRESLPTWRLLKNPLTHAGEIPAEPIADHRRLFLDYEGPLRDDRGSVRRLDRGDAEVQQFDPGRLLATLHGEWLRGEIEIDDKPDAGGCFRKLER